MEEHTTPTDSIRPVRGTLLVKLDQAPEKRGSLFIPETAKERNQRSRTATIVSVGEVNTRDPEHPTYLAEFAPGVRVAYEPMSEHSLSEHDPRFAEGLTIVRMDKVIAVVEDAAPGEFVPDGEELS